MTPPTPQTLGSRLRDAREARGLTTSQLAELTRIKVQQIDGLERDDFSKIPAPMYVKGFIRILAQELALDPKPLLELYADQTQIQPEIPVARDNGRNRPVPVPVPAPAAPVEIQPAVSTPPPEAPVPVRRFSPPPRPPAAPPLRLPKFPEFFKDRRVWAALGIVLGIGILLNLRSCGQPAGDGPFELTQPLLEEPPPIFLELPRTLP